MSFLLPTPFTCGNNLFVPCVCNSCYFVMFICFDFQIPHMREIIQYLYFSVRLISISKIPSSSIHVATNGKISSFLWLNNIPLYMYIKTSLSIHLLMGTQVVCLLAIVNNVAINIGIHISFLSGVFIFFLFSYLVSCTRLQLQQAGSLVAARGLLSCGMRTLSCGMHVGSSSLTRDQTWTPCIGSVESHPLCHQGSPWCFHFLQINTQEWNFWIIWQLYS